MKVEAEHLENAEQNISASLKTAIDTAYENIYKFHKAQKQDTVKVETQIGVLVGKPQNP